MAMASMKMSPKEMNEEMQDCITSDMDKPEYPYGLTINLDDETLQKLGIKEPPAVGAKMMLHAMVEVTSMSQHQNKEHAESNVCLQITDMELQGEQKASVAERLYGNK